MTENYGPVTHLEITPNIFGLMRISPLITVKTGSNKIQQTQTAPHIQHEVMLAVPLVLKTRVGCSPKLLFLQVQTGNAF